MLLLMGLSLLFFLPVIESFDRNLAFNLFMTGSLLVNASIFWKKKLTFDFIELLWLLMLLIFTLSTTLSWSVSRSYFELLRYFAYFLIFVSIRRFPDIQVLIKRFFVPMVIINSIILSLLFISSPILKLPQPENKMSLFEPFYMGHNHLADILIFAIPIAFFFQKKFLSLVLSLFFILMLTLSFSRGAMISLSLVFLFYFVTANLLQNRVNTSVKRVLFLTFVSTIFLISSFIYSNFLIFENNKENALKRFYKPVMKENRFEYFVQAWKGFRQFPVFGTGLDTFRYVSKLHQSVPNSWSWYTHNHFLQIFTETGFLGGLLFLSLILTLLSFSFKNRQLFHGILIAILASTLHSLIDFDWQFISIFLIFWMAVGLLIPKKETDKKGNNLFLILFALTFLILFLSQFFIPLNIEKLLTKDDKTSVLQAYRLDSKNIDIIKKLAQLESKAQNYDQAHNWYLKAIFLVPNEASSLIKQDALLYIVQIKNALSDKNIKLTLKHLETFSQIYPNYFQISGGDYYLVNAYKTNNLKDKAKALLLLKEYTNIVQRKISGYKLNPLEIQAIIDNLQKIKTIY